MSRKLTNDEIIKRFQSIHGNRYDYSKVDYKGNKIPVTIICEKHGQFNQLPVVHDRGGNCPDCSLIQRSNKRRWDKGEFIQRAKEIHDNNYNYSKVEYIDIKTKVEIICKKHGSFHMEPGNHINQKQGCSECYKESLTKLNHQKFIEKSKEIHGDIYDYSKVEYVDMKTPVTIICDIHGEFKQWPRYHIEGSGCHACKKQANGMKFSRKDEFVDRVKKIHKNKYEYPNFENEYKTNKSKITMVCDKGHVFKQIAKDHLRGCGCDRCSNRNSEMETGVEQYFIRNQINYIRRDRQILKGLELDFYLPDHGMAIECNGNYWHCESMGKDKNYHLNKTLMCKNSGVQLLHIFEDELKYKKSIIISKLNSLLKINKFKIHGRKCEVREISSIKKSKFLDKYHIQGNCKSDVRLGLFYKNRLVSVMTFIKPRLSTDDKEFELNRLCSNNLFYIIGGADKMLKYFERNYNPIKVVSYADYRISFGGVYERLNFKLSHMAPPKYWYLYPSKMIRDSKYKFSLKKIKRKYETGELNFYNPELTEWENMQNNGYDRIWDCGNMVFIKEYS